MKLFSNYTQRVLPMTLLAAGLAMSVNAAGAAPAQPCDASPSGPSSQGEGCQAKATLPVGTIQVKLVVEDLDRAEAFYGKVLQLQQYRRFTSSMNRRPMEEILLKKPDGQLVPLVLIKFLDGIAPTHQQAVFVFFTDDIDAFMTRVEQNGGKVTERRDDAEHKARIAFWYDPEGNLSETVQLQ